MVTHTLPYLIGGLYIVEERSEKFCLPSSICLFDATNSTCVSEGLQSLVWILLCKTTSTSLLLFVVYVGWSLFLQNVHVHLPGWSRGPDALWDVPGPGDEDGRLSSCSVLFFFCFFFKCDENVFTVWKPLYWNWGRGDSSILLSVKVIFTHGWTEIKLNLQVKWFKMGLISSNRKRESQWKSRKAPAEWAMWTSAGFLRRLSMSWVCLVFTVRDTSVLL